MSSFEEHATAYYRDSGSFRAVVEALVTNVQDGHLTKEQLAMATICAVRRLEAIERDRARWAVTA